MTFRLTKQNLKGGAWLSRYARRLHGRLFNTLGAGGAGYRRTPQDAGRLPLTGSDDKTKTWRWRWRGVTAALTWVWCRSGALLRQWWRTPDPAGPVSHYVGLRSDQQGAAFGCSPIFRAAISGDGRATLFR